MNNSENLVKDSIIHDMSEGVMTIRFDGIIQYVNPAAEKIFALTAAEMEGKNFASVFLKGEENDVFNQAIIDSVYHKTLQENLVPYNTGRELRQIRIITSYLREGRKRVGVIVVMADITELAELKIRHAQQVCDLLDSMVRAFSKAVDERSHYTANHTKNMVRMAEAFLDWSEKSGHYRRMDEDQRRALIMSVWLHDIGKLAVPLEVLDKATRFGRLLPGIRDRFEKVRLMNKVSLLEGRIGEAEWAELEKKWSGNLAFLLRIDGQTFLSDEDMVYARSLETETYLDEKGDRHSLLNDEEIEAMLIRKGTLTEKERVIVQSHAVITEHILSEMNFPEAYLQVPEWAAGHHEMLDGSGYPRHSSAGAIAPEIRLITILDIFEELTAADRPYKNPFTIKEALSILNSMASAGSIDEKILHLFIESRAWEKVLD